MIQAFLILAVGSLLYGVLLSLLAAHPRLGSDSLPGLRRKVFHVGIFTGAVPAQLLLDFWGVVVYGIVIAGLVLQGYLRGRRSQLFNALARPSEGDPGGKSILVPLLATALGGTASVLSVGEFAVVGYLVCGWGDAAGEVVGRRWGRRRYANPLPWIETGEGRTVEGSMGVAVVGFLGAVVALLLLSQPFAPALGVGLVCGIVGAGAEGGSGQGTDNFWVQLLPSLVAWWFLG